MDISKKLEFYRTTGKASQSSSESKTSPSIRALCDHYNAEIIEPSAPYLKISREVSLSASAGQEYLLDLLSRNSLKDKFDLGQCLFFDLETTGLSGGSGTFAFLLGFLYKKEDTIFIVQYFLPDYGREYFLFKELQDLISSFNILVSYNGKSYDLPLLKSRLLINRIEPVILDKQHLDLLHIARRIWSNSFPSCDLQTLERELSLTERVDDIPGAYIPQAYFDFLNTGNIHNIIRLIEHNYHDLFSLLKLLEIVSNVNTDHTRIFEDKRALIQLAKLAFEEKNEGYFDRIYESFSSAGKEMPLQLLFWKSLFFKRRTEWEGAQELWNRLADSHEYSVFALEELAKYFEHTKKDINRALSCVEKALSQFKVLSDLYFNRDFYKDIQRFRHRKGRLEQKAAISAK